MVNQGKLLENIKYLALDSFKELTMAKNDQILVISLYRNIGSQNLSSDVSLMLTHNSNLFDNLALVYV